eukprot:scaffold576_cov260-Pinguiococcus_pyrenoidosus.AAC.65
MLAYARLADRKAPALDPVRLLEELRRKLKEKEEAYARDRLREQQETLKLADFDYPELTKLEKCPFIDAEGEMNLVPPPQGTRASIYAVFDSHENLAFVGITRNVMASMRQILARQPLDAYYYSAHHVAKPSKATLELIKETWIRSCDAVPKGNVHTSSIADAAAPQIDADSEASWEGATDVKKFMTPEEQAYVHEQRSAGREGPALRVIARKYEADKLAILESRGLATPLRFDPKLKLLGLLDLHTPKKK